MAVKFFVVSAAVVLGVLASVSAGTDVPVGFGPLYILGKCSSGNNPNGIMNCVAEKVLKSLEKVSEQRSMEILPGVLISSDGTENSRMAKQLPTELPNDPSERLTKLMELIANAMSRMITGKTLKIKLPSAETLSRTLEEGRGKNKKMSNSWMMMGGLLLTVIVPLVLAGLGIFTAKAIVVAKLALVVSVITFVQYIMRNGQGLLSGFYGYGSGYGYGTQSTYGVPSFGGTNNLGPASGPYKRSFQDVNSNDAHDMAYSAH